MRTPLTTIKSSLAFVGHINVKDSPDELTEILEMCRAETNRLVFFLNDLRDLFLIESGLLAQSVELNLVPVGPVLEKAIKAVELDAKDKNLEIDYDKDEFHALFEGDAERLSQVLTNILVNAVTFTPENGRITIGITDEDDFTRLSFTDTGIGISENELEHIFEKHYRADNKITRNVVGYGLGLYIAKYLTEFMGGKIYAYSEPGQGSQFDVVLPK